LEKKFGLTCEELEDSSALGVFWTTGEKEPPPAQRGHYYYYQLLPVNGSHHEQGVWAKLSQEQCARDKVNFF
jgi:hypothetical protein